MTSPGEERFDLHIEHPAACSGEDGIYAATLYHLDRGRRFISQTPLKLGSYDESYDNPLELLEQSRREAGRKLGQVIPVEACIALNAARLCTLKPHDDAPRPEPSAGRIERVAALAVVQTPLSNVRIRPFNADETRELVRNHGVGHARRHERLLHVTDLSVVCFPISKQEARDYMVVDVVPAAASTRALSQKPHVALHRRGTTAVLEQIVTLDELQ